MGGWTLVTCPLPPFPYANRTKYMRRLTVNFYWKPSGQQVSYYWLTPDVFGFCCMFCLVPVRVNVGRWVER